MPTLKQIQAAQNRALNRLAQQPKQQDTQKRLEREHIERLKEAKQ